METIWGLESLYLRMKIFEKLHKRETNWAESMCGGGGILDSLLVRKHHWETCVICEESKWKGIRLYNSFICAECEQKIIATDTNDPQYKFYLKQLRKINTPEIFS